MFEGLARRVSGSSFVLVLGVAALAAMPDITCHNSNSNGGGGSTNAPCQPGWFSCQGPEIPGGQHTCQVYSDVDGQIGNGTADLNATVGYFCAWGAHAALHYLGCFETIDDANTMCNDPTYSGGPATSIVQCRPLCGPDAATGSSSGSGGSSGSSGGGGSGGGSGSSSSGGFADATSGCQLFVSQCASDSDCCSGLVCQMSSCVLPTGSRCVGASGAGLTLCCNTNGGTSGTGTVSSQCNQGGNFCSSDADCPLGWTCHSDGACSPICCAGFTTLTNLPPCQGLSLGVSASVCGLPSGAQCVTDDDCESGTCVAGQTKGTCE